MGDILAINGPFMLNYFSIKLGYVNAGISYYCYAGS